MKNTVLVVAAHPDDEVLGCGATMAKHARSGDRVHTVILAEGITSRQARRERVRAAKQLANLARSARRANQLLGVRSLSLHDLPDNRLDSVHLLDVVKLVESYVARLKPNIVYTHHAGDLNIDHRRIHEATTAACRPTPGHTVRTLLFFEVPSSTEWQTPGSAPAFTPNWFVDISGTWPLKLKALKAYQSEMKAWPHPRSLDAVEHLVRWRGACVGAEAVEAFMLGRHIGF